MILYVISRKLLKMASISVVFAAVGRPFQICSAFWRKERCPGAGKGGASVALVSTVWKLWVEFLNARDVEDGPVLA
jgi:hypothetical protein